MATQMGKWVPLTDTKKALEDLVERIELQRSQEKRKVDKAQWTADLERARDLLDLVALAVAGEIIL